MISVSLLQLPQNWKCYVPKYIVTILFLALLLLTAFCSSSKNSLKNDGLCINIYYSIHNILMKKKWERKKQAEENTFTATVFVGSCREFKDKFMVVPSSSKIVLQEFASFAEIRYQPFSGSWKRCTLWFDKKIER